MPDEPPTASQAPAQPTELSTCWNHIGVYGDSSCSELPKFVHCRNCPVYSSAAVQLLHRPLTPEYRNEQTEHFAARRKGPTLGKISVLLFRIANEWLALPTQAFQEVAEQRLVHSLPHRRQAIVLGLVNIRGELVICVSLHRLLGLESVTPRDKARIVHERLLVARWDGHRLVFPVNEVQGIHRLHPEEIKPAPALLAKSSQSYTQSIFVWRDRAVAFLDADAMFSTLNRSLS